MQSNKSIMLRRIHSQLVHTTLQNSSLRLYSTRSSSVRGEEVNPTQQSVPLVESKTTLTHLNASGSAHMVSISSKVATKRTATAVCRVHFSNATTLALIIENKAKKGDVLGVARISGIMAAKRTADLIPLCHPIAITHVNVDVETVGDTEMEARRSKPQAQRTSGDLAAKGDSYQWTAPIASAEGEFGFVEIQATVSCDGKTGVEMEALTAASIAALTVYDMCKAVDKAMRIEGLRVVRKEGGKSGTWVMGRRDNP